MIGFVVIAGTATTALIFLVITDRRRRIEGRRIDETIRSLRTANGEDPDTDPLDW